MTEKNGSRVMGEIGPPMKFHMQVAQVKKVLASVAKIYGAGNRVVFGDEGHDGSAGGAHTGRTGGGTTQPGWLPQAVA